MRLKIALFALLIAAGCSNYDPMVDNYLRSIEATYRHSELELSKHRIDCKKVAEYLEVELNKDDACLVVANELGIPPHFVLTDTAYSELRMALELQALEARKWKELNDAEKESGAGAFFGGFWDKIVMVFTSDKEGE